MKLNPPQRHVVYGTICFFFWAFIGPIIFTYIDPKPDIIITMGFSLALLLIGLATYVAGAFMVLSVYQFKKRKNDHLVGENQYDVHPQSS